MLNKAIIIEFVGPPGAGKTSSCKGFAEHLENKGLTVSTLGDVKKFIKKLNFFEKFILIGKALLFRTHTMLFYIGALAFNGIYSLNSIYRYIRLTLFDLALKKLIKSKKTNVVLLEQWIIQELWSATIFKLQSYSKIKSHISRFYFKTDFVFYFDIDEETASERIKKRNTNLSRFDRFDENRRRNEIKAYSAYLFQLFEYSDCINKHVFCGKQSIEKNAESFYIQLDKACNNKLYSLS